MTKKQSFLLICALVGGTLVVPTVGAQSLSAEERAKKIYEQLTGTKVAADSPALAQMISAIKAGNARGAAEIATANPSFLNITVRQMATKISTRELSITSDFNDFTATIMGVVRDESDARELLYGDFQYRADASKVTVPSNITTDILNSNNHYVALDNKQTDIAASLIRVNGQQLSRPGANNTFTAVANPDPAGILTSRAFLGAHADMGTNRRLVEYTMKAFMCLSMPEWADSNGSDARIGRDIDRFPGGSHTQFLNTCKACHTGMDGFRGAFANWDFANGRAQNGTITPFQCSNAQSAVACKMNNVGNIAYPQGFVTTDNSWVNHTLREDGKNLKLLGFRAPAGINIQSGRGVQSFGRMIAESERFGQCMSLKVFEAVCRQKVDWTLNMPMLSEFGKQFENSKYNMKELFETIAADSRCSG